MRKIDSSNFNEINFNIIKNEMQSLLRYLDELTLPKNVILSANNVIESYERLVLNIQ